MRCMRRPLRQPLRISTVPSTMFDSRRYSQAELRTALRCAPQ
jgi:hypothetical protein